MADNKKPLFRKFLFRGVVLFSMVATKAAATVFPFWSQDFPTSSERWQQVGRDVGGDEAKGGLTPDIVALIQAPAYGTELERVIRLTYAMARGSQVADLDELWTATLLQRSDIAAVTTFLEIRAEIVATGLANGPEWQGESWLWRAKGRMGNS